MTPRVQGVRLDPRVVAASAAGSLLAWADHPRFQSPTIVHAHVGLPDAVAAVALAERLGVPLVTTEHESIAAARLALPGMREAYLRLLGEGRMLLAVSQALRDRLAAALEVDPARIGVVPNVVDRWDAAGRPILASPEIPAVEVGYDPTTYWERLHQRGDLSTVGQSGMSPECNAWLHRTLEANPRRFLRWHAVDHPLASTAFNVGTRIGYRVRFRRSMGISRVDGYDLVPAAVAAASEAAGEVGTEGHYLVADLAIPGVLEGKAYWLVEARSIRMLRRYERWWQFVKRRDRARAPWIGPLVAGLDSLAIRTGQAPSTKFALFRRPPPRR